MLVVLPDAETEFLQAARWYERQQSGIGEEFLDELAETFQQIQEAPTRFPVLETLDTSEGKFQRCRLKRFPYVVVFHVAETETHIIAVSHAHRRPNYWMDRAE